MLGRTGELVGRAARPYVHAAVAAALLFAALLEVGDAAVGPSGQWITWQAPVVLAMVSMTYLGHWALFRRSLSLFPMATAASLAIVSAGQVLQQDSTGAAIELVLLAAAWAAGVARTEDRLLRSLLRLGVAVQALLPWSSWRSRAGSRPPSSSRQPRSSPAWPRSTARPRWLLAAGPTLAGAWYWAGTAIFPDTPPTDENLAVLFAPLPLALGLVGIVLRVSLGTRWALPGYLYSGIALLAVEGLFLAVPSLALAGRWLMADVVVLYAIAALERRHEAAIVAAMGAFAGTALTLAAAGAAPIWYPVALGALSVVVYAGQLPWERLHDRNSRWIAAHRHLGLGGAAMTAVSGFALFDYTRPGTLGCALAGAAVLVFAALLWRPTAAASDTQCGYAAAFAGLAGDLLRRALLRSGQPRVVPRRARAGPDRNGLRMPFDSRLKADHLLPQLAVAAGAMLTLGVTVFAGGRRPGLGPDGPARCGGRGEPDRRDRLPEPGAGRGRRRGHRRGSASLPLRPRPAGLALRRLRRRRADAARPRCRACPAP